MTSLKEYVDYGINKDDFVEMLRVSAATMRAQREGRVYIGVPSKSYREPGGSAFGKLIKRAGNPVQLFVRPIMYNEDNGNPIPPYYFYDAQSRMSWDTGGGNATLSPWDSRKILREAGIA